MTFTNGLWVIITKDIRFSKIIIKMTRLDLEEDMSEQEIKDALIQLEKWKN
jgi:hypothetical protein